jgi:lysosomal Pro-X carboxypeptidase
MPARTITGLLLPLLLLLPQIVTRDATAEAGAAPDCADNVRQAFQLLFELGATEGGRQQLQLAFLLCDPLTGQQQVEDLAYWVQVGS